MEFDARDGRTLVLPRIKLPEKEEAALLLHWAGHYPSNLRHAFRRAAVPPI